MSDRPAAAMPVAGGAGRRLALRWIARIPGSLPLAILLLLSVPPMIDVLLTSLQTGQFTPHPTWTLANYHALWGAFAAGGAILNSLLFALGASCVALLFGFPMALIVERTNTPFRRFGYAIAIILATVPAAVYAVAWMLMFSRQGLANVALAALFGVFGAAFQPIPISNLAGMIVVEGLNYVPLTFLLLVGPVRSMDGSLEEAGLTAGASAWQVFLRITLPPLLPSILATLLLTFIRSLESFSVPAILGLPGRVPVITTEIYSSTVASVPADYGLAGAFGVVLILLVIGVLWGYTALTAQASRFATVSGKAFKARVIAFGRSRYLLCGFLLTFFVIAVVVPFVVLLIVSLQSYYSGASLHNLSFTQYRDIFKQPRIVQSFIDSATVGVVAAALIMLLAFAAGWVAVHGSSRMRRMIEFAASLPLVLPGVVLGLALLQIYAHMPFPIYGTLAALVGSSLIRFIPFGFRYAHTGLMQIHAELEEAGLMSGATRLQTLVRILMPLVALPLIGGFIYVFTLSVRELEASVMLVTGNTPMVAPILLDLFQNSYLPQVAAFSTVIVVAFGCLGYIFHVLARRYGVGGQLGANR